MKQLERMLSGKLYHCGYKDSDREEMFNRRNEFLDKFNSTSYADFKTREELCKKYFGSTGDSVCINKPFHCDYGANIHIGERFYANFDCIMLDVAHITIGNDVFFGPRVCVYTAGHPIDANIRNTGLEYGKEVKIGNSVWIGGNCVICPGVKVGDNAVIGANSVVTKDIPSNVIACGNPCHVIRQIDECDKEKWEKEAEEFYFDCGKE